MGKGTLYVVATPIGNLEDMTPRAVRILKDVDCIAAEDTRHSRKLLAHFDVHTPLTSYHEHNEAEKTARLIGMLESGRRIALITDAGTPAVSDPGYRLVRAAHTAGYPVISVPGPCAAITALAASGLPSDAFSFHGFFPRRTADGDRLLTRVREAGGTHIVYESPQRVSKTLARIAASLPGAEVCVARELTKKFEETVVGPASQIAAQFAESTARGEYVIIVSAASPRPADAEVPDADTLRRMVEETMAAEGLSKRDAVRRIAERLDLPRKAVYAAAAG